MKTLKLTGLLSLSLFVQTTLSGASIQLNGNSIVLDYNDLNATEFSVYRSKGRFAEWELVGKTTDKTITDSNLNGLSPYTYYYHIQDENNNTLANLALDTELWGENVHIYSPDDNMEGVKSEFNGIHDAMKSQQFGTGRNQMFFKPGDYRGVNETLNVPYYMSVSGLGKLPTEVKLLNVITPAPLPDNNATCTFWRSIENVGIYFLEEYNEDDRGSQFWWGVSQAAPIRRVYSQRNTVFDYYGGWASGGFTGDCYFEKGAGSYSQQQWYTRNSHLTDGNKGFTRGGWNGAYQGITWGNTANVADLSDNWAANNNMMGNVSRVEKTPVIREKPFVFIGDDGKYKVFRPALRRDAIGTSWTKTNMGEGTVLDVLTDFYVAKPTDNAATINAQLAAGKNIILTPGIYMVETPIKITRENTIFMGLGYATLIGTKENGDCVIEIGDVDGVSLSSILMDTYYNTNTLVRVGKEKTNVSHASNPTILSDIFLRVGGVKDALMIVTYGMEINSNDVVGDHFWIWRADHGTGVSWYKNKAQNGLVVNGDNVTIYGLCNEHFQEYQTLWNGEYGKTFFYQSETPYDPPSQDKYMSHDGTVEGYASYKVADHVKHHYACMLGIYDVFTQTSNKIAIHSSIEVPNANDVKIHNACNVCLSGAKGGFMYVVNEKVKSTYFNNNMNRYYIVDYFFEANPPTAPKNLAVTKTTAASITIKWEASEDESAVSYNLYLNDELVKNVTALQYTYRSLKEGTTYKISIEAIDEYGNKSEKLSVNAIPGQGQSGEVAINETEKAIINVYPNPVDDVLFINTDADNYKVAIYDMRGTMIAEYQNATEIDMSSIMNGLYFVKVITNNNQIAVIKIIRR